jgi:cell wall-associated NlpC family hydrolase
VRRRIQLTVGGLLAALLMLAVLPVTAASAAGNVLRQGSRGSAVVVLQRDLHLRADGAFGPQTKRAVVAFQRRHHLTADGVVGARTWAALGGAPRAAAPVRRVAARPAGYGTNSTVETAAVRLAAAQRGKPYRYGAAGPHSFDCSGLVQYVYRHVGVSVPRTTYSQYAAAIHIPRSQMRPGDLIFVDGLSHVGIYAGFGFIWHAPHTGARVRLSLIWDRNYRVARVR